MKTLADKRQAASKVAELGLALKPAQAESAQQEALAEKTVVATLVETLAGLGVEQAFGVSGGAIALLFDALQESPIELHHFRHETGAAFAATEAYFMSRKPVVVFATTGPGTLNTLTGLTAARWDGAKVVLVSGATGAAQRGRWATQETSPYTMPQDALYTKGSIFDFAARIERASELPEVMRRLTAGLSRPGGFVAHVSMPMSIQSSRVDRPRAVPRGRTGHPATSPEDIAETARRLRQGPFAVWVGFGATRAAPLVRELVERSGAMAFCSPRAKGIVPESHLQFVGVTGLGGHRAVTEYMVQHKPGWVLVLGSRLGEATSFWDRDLEPSQGFLHVDLDLRVPGTAYPDCRTIAIQAEIGHFLKDLLPHFANGPGADGDADGARRPAVDQRSPADRAAGRKRLADRPIQLDLAGRSPVRPQLLMAAIQRHVLEASDAPVLSECGNSFAWCNHHLQFEDPGRYRVSTLFGSMGHMAAGVVGAALARRGKAVAVVGDGSMLMSSELSTAAQYRTPAVWVVLNDAGYGMCRDGHRTLGLTGEGVDFPRTDFVKMARSVGADGVRVESEDALAAAFEQAMAAPGPFVIDVDVDPDEPSPLLSSFESLVEQGGSKNVAGREG